MAKLVFTNCYLAVNGVDLSDHVRSVELSLSREDVQSTTMGASGVGRLPGLRDESITVTWAQDFAASKVDQTLEPLYANGTSHTVAVRPVNGAIATTNPEYTGTCYLLEYQPIAGDVGSLLESETTFSVDGVLTYDTTP